MSNPKPFALTVMARYPRLGRVKTRLAAEIGDERAYELYAAFLRDLHARFAARPEFDLVWAFEPESSPFAEWMGGEVSCRPQRGEGLGERMAHVFSTLLGEGYAKVVMTGSDIPHLEESALVDAWRALDTDDVVLGPSIDGGYYLVGLSKAHDIFRGVEMGTGEVLAETLRRCRHLGLRAACLAESFDIDEVADVVRLAETSMNELPRSRRILEEWRMR